VNGTPLAIDWTPLHKAGKTNLGGHSQMKNILFNLYVKFQDLKNGEAGQDLVEYALVVALIAFGSTAGMSTLADGINSVFNTISSNLANSL
jgi:pilus assembly protein Flp/PilA